MVQKMKLKICLALLALACVGLISSAGAVSDDEAVTVINNLLKDNGFSDVTTRIGDGRAQGGSKSLILSYHSKAVTTEALATETGQILGAYLGVIKLGWDCDGLSVVVGDRVGNAIGMWHCQKEWQDSWVKGKMSDEEILLRVFGTMQTF